MYTGEQCSTEVKVLVRHPARMANMYPFRGRTVVLFEYLRQVLDKQMFTMQSECLRRNRSQLNDERLFPSDTMAFQLQLKYLLQPRLNARKRKESGRENSDKINQKHIYCKSLRKLTGRKLGMATANFRHQIVLTFLVTRSSVPNWNAIDLANSLQIDSSESWSMAIIPGSRVKKRTR